MKLLKKKKAMQYDIKHLYIPIDIFFLAHADKCSGLRVFVQRMHHRVQ